MQLTTAEVRAHAADPALAAALAADDDEAAAARLCALLTELHPLPLHRLAAWGAPAVRARLEDHSNNPSSPLRSFALSTLDLLRGSMSDTFNLAQDGRLLDALVAGGAVTQAERDELYAMALQPRRISASDVARAVRADDGTRLI